MTTMPDFLINSTLLNLQQWTTITTILHAVHAMNLSTSRTKALKLYINIIASPLKNQ